MKILEIMHLLSVIFLIWLNVSIQANVDFSNISVYFGRHRYKWEYVIVTKINRIYTCDLHLAISASASMAF